MWLREEVARKSQDTQELDKQQKMAAQAEKKYKQLSEKMKKELETLQNQRSEVASVQGEIAALRFGKHFEETTEKYENIAEKRWYVFGKLSFIVLFGVVIINLIAYIVLFVGEKLKWWPLKPTEFFTLEYGLVKLALLLLLSYAVGFSVKQYNVNSHLAATNKHRKNIAETMKDFYESDLDDSAKTAIIHRGTQAMFKHLPIGYISKSEHRNDDGPMHQIINKIPNIKSG